MHWKTTIFVVKLWLVLFSAFKHRYGQTCHHVAGLLFRVEYANKMEYTSCTSNKCEWAVSKERPLEPTMLQDTACKRSKHGKTGMIYMWSSTQNYMLNSVNKSKMQKSLPRS